MTRVVVIGGGFGGMATAARLAKLGHDVTLLERSARTGGAVGRIERDGFTWDAGPTSTLMPAVLRDLFRKSGRALEAELKTELEPLPVLREHRFVDGSRLALPTGRAGQLRAWEGYAPGAGEQWVAWVASFAEDWEVIRRRYAEVPWNREPRRTPESRELLSRLDSRESLQRRLRTTFHQQAPRLVAAHPFVADGHDPRRVPAWSGLVSYLEQRFGAWRVPGGMGVLADALQRRLGTRKVEVVTDCEVLDIALRHGRAVAVTTTQGEHPADVVVCAIDPRRIPALARYVARTAPAPAPAITHLGLRGDLPDLSHETVLHGDPLLVVRTGGSAPPGHQAWTVHSRVVERDRTNDDVVSTLAQRGLDLRAQMVSRVDRSPHQVAGGGSPYGVLWQGRRTVRDRLGPDTPLANVYAAGASATPGAGLPFVGLSAALVAQRVGPA